MIVIIKNECIVFSVFVGICESGFKLFRYFCWKFMFIFSCLYIRRRVKNYLYVRDLKNV